MTVCTVTIEGDYVKVSMPAMSLPDKVGIAAHVLKYVLTDGATLAQVAAYADQLPDEPQVTYEPRKGDVPPCVN